MINKVRLKGLITAVTDLKEFKKDMASVNLIIIDLDKNLLYSLSIISGNAESKMMPEQFVKFCLVYLLI